MNTHAPADQVCVKLRRTLTLMLLCAACLPVSALANTEDDRAERALKQAGGHMTAGSGPAHSGKSGAPWSAVFKERFESTTFYSVCVRSRVNRKVRRCARSETDARGRDRISFARFLSGKSGKFVAEWDAGGLRWQWRFRVR
jgi:hypothetical protein